MLTGEQAIFVRPFSNATLQPRVGEEVTQQIRKQVQKEATFRLGRASEADIIIGGDVIRYQRFEMSFAPNDVLTVRDFRVTMTAHVIARDRINDKVLLDRNVSGSTLVRVGYDLTSAERQALPLLAADLARNVVSLIADGDF